MPLTRVERDACRQARFLKGSGHGYGTPVEGYCPIGAVAVLRGAQFQVGPDGEYTSFDRVIHEDGTGHYAIGETRRITLDVHRDVLAWTGYKNTTLFLHALEAHGAAIFPAEHVSP